MQLSKPVSADESLIKALDTAGKRSSFALRSWSTTTPLIVFSPRSMDRAATVSQPLPPCIFSLSLSFNLLDEIHSLDRVALPTHLLFSTFARAPSFFLWKARSTGDAKAASRHLEGKSTYPWITRQMMGRGVE